MAHSHSSTQKRTGRTTVGRFTRCHAREIGAHARVARSTVDPTRIGTAVQLNQIEQSSKHGTRLEGTD